VSKAKSEVPIKPVEQWATEKQIADWLFAAAKTGHRWPQGVEFSEADFDAAIERAAHTQIS
jgi:hypothetical protein